MPVAFRDRSRRLVVFGVLAALAGGLFVLLGLAHLLLPLADDLLPSGTAAPVDTVSIVTGMLLYVSIGAVVLWAGIGSVRLRRWVRPVMLVIAWTWAITGLFATLMTWGLADDLLVMMTAEAGAERLPPELAGPIKLLIVGFAAAAGVLFPSLLVWAYHDRDVGRTCEARHPETSWTDQCPLTVLGLSLGLAFLAVLAVPTALRPAVPLFGRLVTGWPGALVVLAGGAFAALLAWSTYRLRPWGWWLTTALLATLGASAAVTFWQLDPIDLYRAMGYPQEQLDVLGRSPAMGRGFVVGTSVAVTALSLIYMAAVRRHFTTSGSR